MHCVYICTHTHLACMQLLVTGCLYMFVIFAGKCWHICVFAGMCLVSRCVCMCESEHEDVPAGQSHPWRMATPQVLIHGKEGKCTGDSDVWIFTPCWQKIRVQEGLTALLMDGLGLALGPSPQSSVIDSVLLTPLPFGLQVPVWPHRWRRLVVLHLDHHLLLHSQPGRLPDRGEDGISHWECRGPSEADRNRLRDPRSGIHEGVLQGRDIPCPRALPQKGTTTVSKISFSLAWDYRQLLNWA